ncbi:MAG: ABC transporter substrate-binding protein [Dictyoglomaceae bacterium]|nr:ABC transporter substrate-binding protein [Dictyoglomaceae bacterium]
MKNKIFLIIFISILISLIYAQPSVVLRIAIHSDFDREGFDLYLEEYSKLHPNVRFEKEVVPFEEYLTKLLTDHLAGNPADIYHIYSLWGVQLVRDKILSDPPSNVILDVRKNYHSVAIKGATIDGKIRGIPTEIDNYCLIYNKALLRKEGFTEPPKTWEELINMGKKLTKYDARGRITQYGFVFLAGWDSAVVHPYLSLVYSNGGKFLSSDEKRCLLDSREAISALEAEVRLFKEKITDLSGNVFDFPNGNIAMMIMAPWIENNLKTTMGENYKDVGVAPIPYLKKPATLLYTWFFMVDSKSKYKKEAWDFLMWFSSEIQKNNTTRLGDYLVEKVGAIPSRLIDLQNHPEQLYDQFTKTFVEELKNSIAEPNIPNGAKIKTILMNEIVTAWKLIKTPEQALKDAVKEINKLLQ